MEIRQKDDRIQIRNILQFTRELDSFNESYAFAHKSPTI